MIQVFIIKPGTSHSLPAKFSSCLTDQLPNFSLALADFPFSPTFRSSNVQHGKAEKRQQLNVKSSISCGLRRLSWQTGTETHTHTQAQAHTQIATPTQGQKHLHKIIIQAGNRFRSLAGQMHFRRASNAPPTNPLPLLCSPPRKRKTNENVCPAHNALGFQDARTPAYGSSGMCVRTWHFQWWMWGKLPEFVIRNANEKLLVTSCCLWLRLEIQH